MISRLDVHRVLEETLASIVVYYSIYPFLMDIFIDTWYPIHTYIYIYQYPGSGKCINSFRLMLSRQCIIPVLHLISMTKAHKATALLISRTLDGIENPPSYWWRHAIILGRISSEILPLQPFYPLYLFHFHVRRSRGCRR